MRAVIAAVAFTEVVVMLCASSEASDAGGPSAEVFAGAPAMGQAMVMTSRSSLLSISFNAAGLAELEGTQMSLGSSPGAVFFERTGPAASDEDRFTKVLLITPNFAAGSRLNTTRFVFGVAMTAASGFGTDWSDAGPSRYFSTESQIGTLRFNPTVAYKASSRLSLGVGIDYILGSADLRSRVNVAALNAALGGSFSPDADGAAKTDLSGTHWGYNLGILMHFGEHHHLGASYRSRLPTRYEGTLQFSGLKDQSAGIFGGTAYSTHIETVVPFPETLSVGYTFQPTSNLDISVEGQWANWSVFQEQEIAFTEETNPIRLAVLNMANPAPKRWKDVHSYGMGTEYRVRKNLRLRSGVYFAPSPVPDSTFDPATPFLDRIGVALGAGHDWRKNLTVDAGIVGAIHRSRNIDNEVGAPVASADGKYQTFWFVFGLNLTYRR